MSLDDRLRGAYRRQLEDVQARIAAGATNDDAWSPSDVQLPAVATNMNVRSQSATARLLAAAAVVVVAVTGALAVTTRLDRAETLVSTDSPMDDTGQTDTSPPVVTTNSTSTPSTVTTTGRTEQVSTSSPATAPPLIEPDQVSTTSQAASAAGITTDVCPSGFRAELESATTTYVGDEQGWNRKHNLIDEQDGPYYFQAWEPNYPGSVTVEVVLAEPVAAGDIRVFQDPFTAVDGSVSIEVSGTTDEGRRLEIGLSGVDGWRTHTFDEAVLIERFTISRNQAESNIMEVMICLA